MLALKELQIQPIPGKQDYQANQWQLPARFCPHVGAQPSFSFHNVFAKARLVRKVRFNQTWCTPAPLLLLYTHPPNDYGLTQADLVQSPEGC